MGFRGDFGLSRSLLSFRSRFQALLPHARRILAHRWFKPLIGALLAVQLALWADERSSRVAIENWLEDSAPSPAAWERALESRGFSRVPPQEAHPWVSSLPVSWDQKNSVWWIEGIALAIFHSTESPPSVFVAKSTTHARRPHRKEELRQSWTRWGQGWVAFTRFWETPLLSSPEPASRPLQEPADPRELNY